MQASKTQAYRSTLDAFVHIYRHEGGVLGLYRVRFGTRLYVAACANAVPCIQGVGPTVVRAAVLTSFQLATYETAKRAIIDSRM